MVREEQFELREGSQVCATLVVEPDGTKTLKHALTEYEVRTCPGLLAYDSSGQALGIRQGQYVYLNAPDGGIRLKLQMGSAGEISDVVDPKAQVQLVVKLSGGGSIKNDLVEAGELVVNLRWIAEAK